MNPGYSLYVTVVEAAPNAMVMVDQAGKIVLMNSQAEKLFGYCREELMGQSIELLVPGPMRARHSDYQRGFFANPTARPMGAGRDLYGLRKDGGTVAVEIGLNALTINEGTFVLASIIDITERKRSEEQIQRGLQRLLALHEVDLAITSTLELRVILELLLEKIDLFLPSAAATTVCLFDRKSSVLEPIVCRNLDEGEWQSEEWRTGHGLAQAVVETKASLQVADVQTDPRTKDYGFFRRHGLVSYLGVPLIAKGEVLGVLGFYTKEARQFTEEEVEFLKALGGQAAIAIHNAQLYEEITRQAAELEKASKVKSEFLGFISHELKTPLNVVMGYTGMIKDKILVDQGRALGRIAKSSNELLTMIDSILDATRIESGTTSVQSEGFHLGNFLIELKSFYDFSSDKEVRLVWDYPSGLPTIRTDSVKLKHVLQNLINNALKFTDKGHVTISVRMKQATGERQQAEEALIPASSLAPRSTEAHDRSRAFFEFKVADTGIGIPKDALPYVFEKFHQADISAQRSQGGVGLGLHIVKTFVRMLGGEVEVESELGKGSTFIVTIPYCS